MAKVKAMTPEQLVALQEKYQEVTLKKSATALRLTDDAVFATVSLEDVLEEKAKLTHMEKARQSAIQAALDDDDDEDD